MRRQEYLLNINGKFRKIWGKDIQKKKEQSINLQTTNFLIISS